MVLFVFPWVYYQLELVFSPQGRIAYPEAVLYSIQSALIIDHVEPYAVGYGKLLDVVESALSWLGLGVFIWWLTRRLDRNEQKKAKGGREELHLVEKPVIYSIDMVIDKKEIWRG